MINPINNDLSTKMASLSNDKKSNGQKAGDTSFTELLKKELNNTNEVLKNADSMTEAFALGQVDDLHQVTVATEKAKLALNMTLSVQNKVLEAYNEIMRMQI